MRKVLAETSVDSVDYYIIKVVLGITYRPKSASKITVVVRLS